MIYFFVITGIFVLILIVGLIIYMLLPGPKTPDFEKEISEYAGKNGYDYKDNVTDMVRPDMKATDAWGFHGQQARYALIKKYDNMELMHFFFTSKQGTNSQYDMEIRYLATIANLNLINGAIKLEIEYPGDELAMGPEYDMDFENKAFSDMYLIGANPNKFAYDFFTPRMIETFMAAEVHRMKVRRGRVVIYNLVNLEEWKEVPPLLKDWAETYTPFCEKINKFVPGYLRKKKNASMKEEEDEPSPLSLTCPECKADFSLVPVNGLIECPECGTKGVV